MDQELLADDVRIRCDRGPTATLTAQRAWAARLQQLEESRRLVDHSAEARDLNAHCQKAFALLTSDRAAKHSTCVRASKASRAHGKTEFGQRCLLARRLAEAGVPMINVSYCHTPQGSWDTHSQNFNR